jgi:ABC-type transport system involved in multi-copper enzyme maturation permease subunit
MWIIWVIAKNTYREIIRDRILYGLVVFAILLFALSMVLGQLSFAEQSRISANLGFMGIHLASVIITIFIGSTLVAKEIEKQTVHTLLARPLSRFQFLAGKMLGLTLLLALILILLSGFLAIVLWLIQSSWSVVATQAIIGIFFETLVLLSMIIMFGVLSKPVLAVTFVIAAFLVGHWVDSLSHLLGASNLMISENVVKVFEYTIPNLEHFNWRNHVPYDIIIPWSEVLWAGCYCLVWVSVFLSLAGLIFRRKDFV